MDTCDLCGQPLEACRCDWGAEGVEPRHDDTYTLDWINVPPLLEVSMWLWMAQDDERGEE